MPKAVTSRSSTSARRARTSAATTPTPVRGPSRAVASKARRMGDGDRRGRAARSADGGSRISRGVSGGGPQVVDGGLDRRPQGRLRARAGEPGPSGRPGPRTRRSRRTCCAGRERSRWPCAERSRPGRRRQGPLGAQGRRPGGDQNAQGRATTLRRSWTRRTSPSQTRGQQTSLPAGPQRTVGATDPAISAGGALRAALGADPGRHPARGARGGGPQPGGLVRRSPDQHGQPDLSQHLDPGHRRGQRRRSGPGHGRGGP